MMEQSTQSPALQRMLEAFPQAEQKSNGWYTHVDNPRFDFIENENGSITIHSWTGKTPEHILAMRGLTRADITSHGFYRVKVRPTIDLFTLAQAKRIHWSFLLNLGITDGYKYHGRSYVKIPYYHPDGTPHTKIRVRKQVYGDYKQCWDEGTPGQIIPYGLQKLDMARNAGYLLIGEGETDAWACWYHSIPYLGIPGATFQKALAGIDLSDIPTIYILTEPDQIKSMIDQGESFYKNIHNILRSEGYDGDIFCIHFDQATTYKDPSEMHIALWDAGTPERFSTLMEQARVQALPANDYMEQEKHAPTLKRPGGKHKITPWPVPDEQVLERLAENEYGDGRLFKQAFSGQVCYDHTSKEWYVWNNHYWEQDKTKKVQLLVSGELGSIYLRTIANLNPSLAALEAQVAILPENDPKGIAIRNQVQQYKETMETLRKRATALRTNKRDRDVQAFIQAEMPVTTDMWDRQPWLLPAVNGVIDLRTGEFRDGEPEDYIKTISPTPWEGLNAPCPRWKRFLEEVFEDKPDRDEMIAFLRRLLGMALVGKVTEHVFPVFYGAEGRNGKDTIFKTIGDVLGALAGAVSNDVFIAQGKDRSAGSATPHLVDLQGKRIVWGSETKQGAQLNVSQIKQLTGGGNISARKNFGEQYAFPPSHTLFLHTNYKPHADATDKAFWSRVCLIEFGLRFIDEPVEAHERRRDPTLDDTLMQEKPGILAWLVQGCLEWQEHGLNMPESVKVSNTQYREDEDTLLLFIRERCFVQENMKSPADRLYETYVTWCKANSVSAMSGIQFGKDMGKRFGKVKARRGNVYLGIGILTDQETESVHSVHGSEKLCTPSNVASQADLNGGVHSVHGFSPIVGEKHGPTSFYEGRLGKTMHTMHTPAPSNGTQPSSQASLEGVHNHAHEEKTMHTQEEERRNTSPFDIEAQLTTLADVFQRRQKEWTGKGVYQPCWSAKLGYSPGYISVETCLWRLRQILTEGTNEQLCYEARCYIEQHLEER